MSFDYNNNIEINNPFAGIYKEKINVILHADGLIGNVRGKSANGLMMHSRIFNIVGIIDKKMAGAKTSKVCPGVNIDVPIFLNIDNAIKNHNTKAIVFLNSISGKSYNDIKIAVENGLDIINTGFSFIKHNKLFIKLIEKHKVRFFDLRDVTHQQAYPNTEIVNRKSKVIFITGTDCGIGKRTASYELLKESERRGIKAAMYATGQTGLMLGESGTVIDALILEFSNGIVSQHVKQFCDKGYKLIFVEGQSDIYHPANSAVSLALLHGANPDCIIIVHDENRKVHKGFEEESLLYRMHSINRYIDTLEKLSLPCGPEYKTVGIATIGVDNIKKLRSFPELQGMPIADVRQPGGAGILLDSILDYLKIQDNINSMKNNLIKSPEQFFEINKQKN